MRVPRLSAARLHTSCVVGVLPSGNVPRGASLTSKMLQHSRADRSCAQLSPKSPLELILVEGLGLQCLSATTAFDPVFGLAAAAGLGIERHVYVDAHAGADDVAPSELLGAYIA